MKKSHLLVWERDFLFICYSFTFDAFQQPLPDTYKFPLYLRAIKVKKEIIGKSKSVHYICCSIFCDDEAKVILLFYLSTKNQEYFKVK
jgi:hypothetical protein